jgi:uncharacterized metal-binding protein
MPNHKTHEYIGTLAIIPIAATALYFGHSIQKTTVLAIGILFATYYLSPDLDHDVGAASYRRWGILRFIWYPYKKLIPHRSWISHSGPISATLRLLYMSLWILPLLLYIHVSLLDLQFQSLYVILWIALILADTIHLIMDKIWKDTK